MALSDPLGIMASPLTIITREDDETAVAEIVDIIRQNDVVHIVVGLPVNMDGTMGIQVEKVRDFIAVLCRHTEVPVEFKDERLSTVVAKRIIQRVRKTNRATRYDSAAAALILQAYLDDTA